MAFGANKGPVIPNIKPGSSEAIAIDILLNSEAATKNAIALANELKKMANVAGKDTDNAFKNLQSTTTRIKKEFRDLITQFGDLRKAGKHDQDTITALTLRYENNPLKSLCFLSAFKDSSFTKNLVRI